MWNGLTEIRIEAKSVTRAHWTFDQPTRGGMKSHLTYNEYPLEVTKLEIDDELGIRNRKDWGTIRGNAEHSWGYFIDKNAARFIIVYVPIITRRANYVGRGRTI